MKVLASNNRSEEIDTQSLYINSNKVVFEEGFQTESQELIKPVEVQYTTYGKRQGDNVIVVFHALTGNSQPIAVDSDGKDNVSGWWGHLMGDGLPLDTSKYFIVCINMLGSCYGTTGPSSINPKTNKAFGLDFPVVTITDIVKLQKKVLEYLNIDKVFAVVGGSLGGMQAIEFSILYPDSVSKVVAISCADKTSPWAMGMNKIARESIMSDKNWNNGNYYNSENPVNGLRIARMVGHISYLSHDSFESKFGRKFIDSDKERFKLNSRFDVEGYLEYNSEKFINRFDANTLLYLLKAMDLFDLSYTYGSLDSALKRIKAKTLLLSFSSDMLFRAVETEDLYHSYIKNNLDCKCVNIINSYGHDSFLIKSEKQNTQIERFLNS